MVGAGGTDTPDGVPTGYGTLQVFTRRTLSHACLTWVSRRVSPERAGVRHVTRAGGRS